MDSKQLEKSEEEFQYSELSLNRAGHSRFPDKQSKHAVTCEALADKGTLEMPQKRGNIRGHLVGVSSEHINLLCEIFYGTKEVRELIFLGAESKSLGFGSDTKYYNAKSADSLIGSHIIL